MIPWQVVNAFGITHLFQRDDPAQAWRSRLSDGFNLWEGGLYNAIWHLLVKLLYHDLSGYPCYQAVHIWPFGRFDKSQSHWTDTVDRLCRAAGPFPHWLQCFSYTYKPICMLHAINRIADTVTAGFYHYTKKQFAYWIRSRTVISDSYDPNPKDLTD